MEWETLDTFYSSQADLLDKIMNELKEKQPDIDWNTKWNGHEDMHGNPTSYISLCVPLEQYDEAIEIYNDFEFENEKEGSEPTIFDELINEIIEFRDERNWGQFHNPKDLALSLSLEASELLENFQWKTSEEAIDKKLDNIKDEVADIVIYSLLLSNELGIDLEESIWKKLKKNRTKYPVDKAYNSSKKYTDL